MNREFSLVSGNVFFHSFVRSRQTQEQNKPSTLGWNKEGSYVKQIQKAFIFQKGMRKKGRRGDPLIQFNGRSQDREEERPDSNLAATQTFPLAPCFCLTASWVWSNLFLISPSTKESNCEWPLGRRSFEEQAKQWAVCHPRGWRGQEVDSSEDAKSHRLQYEELKWSPRGKTVFHPCLWVYYSVCPPHLGLLMSFWPFLSFRPHHPLTT